MAAEATFYKDAALTDSLSDGDWTNSLDLGTVNIPESGSAHTDGVQVWLENSGDTDLEDIEITMIDGEGETATVYDDRVSFAPNDGGSPGSWGTDGDPFEPDNMNPTDVVTFWVRTRADAGDTQPSNPVNMSFKLDATSV